MPHHKTAVVAQQIRRETARRKHIWRKMEAAGREAVGVVSAQAKNCGISDMEWFSNPWIKEPGKAFVTYIHPAGIYKGTTNGLELDVSGKLALPFTYDDRYEGYPELTEEDPVVFKKAATKRLLTNLHEYTKRR